jgi:hypothetical protein
VHAPCCSRSRHTAPFAKEPISCDKTRGDWATAMVRLRRADASTPRAGGLTHTHHYIFCALLQTEGACNRMSGSRYAASIETVARIFKFATDGNWQIQWVDTTGCSDLSSFSLTISNDAISSGGATGRVDEAGNITFSRARNMKGVTRHYVGRLSGNSGPGRFDTFGGPCIGRFAATRQ